MCIMRRQYQQQQYKKIHHINDFSDDEYSDDEEEDEEDGYTRDIALAHTLVSNKTRKEIKRDETKLSVLYSTGIFLLLSIPITDTLIKTGFPLADSWLILLGIKTVVFFLLVYLITMKSG